MNIFKTINSIFDVISDGAESASAAIHNFKRDQQVDHVLEESTRQVRVVRETRKNIKEMYKHLQGCTEEEMKLINQVNEKLGLNNISLPK